MNDEIIIEQLPDDLNDRIYNLTLYIYDLILKNIDDLSKVNEVLSPKKDIFYIPPIEDKENWLLYLYRKIYFYILNIVLYESYPMIYTDIKEVINAIETNNVLSKYEDDRDMFIIVISFYSVIKTFFDILDYYFNSENRGNLNQFVNDYYNRMVQYFDNIQMQISGDLNMIVNFCKISLYIIAVYLLKNKF